MKAMTTINTGGNLPKVGECKFCGADLAIFGRDCEWGSDSETYEPYYCGHLCCNACGGQCQGNPVSDMLRGLACLNRAITERRPFSFLSDRTMHGRKLWIASEQLAWPGDRSDDAPF